MAYEQLAMPPLGTELASMVAGIVIIAFVGRRSIGEMITAIRQIIVPTRISVVQMPLPSIGTGGPSPMPKALVSNHESGSNLTLDTLT